MVKIVLFITACFLFSCNAGIKKVDKSEISDAALFKDSFVYKVFETANGYGFDVLKNGKVYIHQPLIPFMPGFQAFAKEADAKAIGEFIVNRLKAADFKFLLQKFELDSILHSKEKPYLKTIAKNKAFVNFNSPIAREEEIIKRTIDQPFPALENEPLKIKWTTKGNVPFGKRCGSFVFCIGEFVYMGSGENQDNIIQDFWRYDATDNVWTCLAEAPAKCFSGASFSVYGKGYAGLGTEIGTSSGKFEKHMFEYDPEANSWKRLKDFPGTARIDPSVFVIDNNAYVGSGYDGSNTKDFYQYDPKKDQWTKIADFPGGPFHASIGIGTGKKGFIVAGSRAPIDFNFVYEYLPAKNKWQQRQDIPGLPRFFLSGCDIDVNHIIAGSGGSYESGKRSRDFYVYDITKNIWSRIPDYPIGTLGDTRACSANVDGKIFMGTGYNRDYLSDWNEFEYYFTVRTDTGNYNETTGYPLKYDGQWNLFQECTKNDCYAGIELKCDQQLGDFFYASRFNKDTKATLTKDNAGNNLLLFPRIFFLKTDKQPSHPIVLRLFFTARELKTALDDCIEKTKTRYSISDLKILQRDETTPDALTLNVSFQKNNYSLIKPQFYEYGYNGSTIIAEFPVSALHSEFYLVLPHK